MKIGQEFLLMVTISYPIWTALFVLATGIFLADLVERRDNALILLVAASTIMAARFAILAVSLGEQPAWLDRYAAQEIAAVCDFAALLLVLPYAWIILRRRWLVHRIVRRLQREEGL